MAFSIQIAQHLREVFFGGNWTDSNLRDTLKGIPFEKITISINSSNSILALTYHIRYFISAILEVYREGKLSSKDAESFFYPEILTEDDWIDFQSKIWEDVEKLAKYIESMHDDNLKDTFMMEKYGNYYRNLHGLIEHSHYHLGQIASLKKLINT